MQKRPSELPPSFVFHSAFADSGEREQIVARMRALDRQTMNIRTQPQARMLRLREGSAEGPIVAWCGFSLRGSEDPKAEFFSLHVEESHRSFLLGLYLETLRAELAREHGVDRALTRMDSASNSILLEYRSKNRLMTTATDLAPSVLAECEGCELFRGKCASQVYLWTDVDALIRRGLERLQFSPVSRGLPGIVEFNPAIFRKVPR